MRFLIAPLLSFITRGSATPAEATLYDAVMHQSSRLVTKLIKAGADLEAADHKGQTALIFAATTDQFRIANKLLDAGANPFAVSDFGWTAGYAAQTSRLIRGPEFKALQVFKEKMRDCGYPLPGPDKPEIKEMVKQGKWPPKK